MNLSMHYTTTMSPQWLTVTMHYTTTMSPQWLTVTMHYTTTLSQQWLTVTDGFDLFIWCFPHRRLVWCFQCWGFGTLGGGGLLAEKIGESGCQTTVKVKSKSGLIVLLKFTVILFSDHQGSWRLHLDLFWKAEIVWSSISLAHKNSPMKITCKIGALCLNWEN